MFPEMVLKMHCKRGNIYSGKSTSTQEDGASVAFEHELLPLSCVPPGPRTKTMGIRVDGWIPTLDSLSSFPGKGTAPPGTSTFLTSRTSATYTMLTPWLALRAEAPFSCVQRQGNLKTRDCCHFSPEFCFQGSSGTLKCATVPSTGFRFPAPGDRPQESSLVLPSLKQSVRDFHPKDTLKKQSFW